MPLKQTGMKNIKHPAFLTGILTVLFIIFAVATKSYGYRIGSYLFIAAALLAGITWVWGVIDVVSRADMKPFQKRFWLIVVVAVPFMGAMIFYILHQKANRLTT